MKTHFGLPSCNYNISLSKGDLKELLEKGSVIIQISKTPCTTSRAIYDGDMNFLDKKEICNNLRFTLSEDVADISERDWAVQFLGIFIDK